MTLKVDESQVSKWFVDAAIAVNSDMKSHTGLLMTLGNGACICSSTKQITNSRSTTEVKLNAVDKKLIKGFPGKTKFNFQDNTSLMKLQKNEKNGSGKRTIHFDIDLFVI